MIFYSVVAYLFAFILLCYSLLNFKKNSIYSSLLFILTALVYIAAATMSFIIEDKYEWILVITLIVNTIIDLIVFYSIKDKNR